MLFGFDSLPTFSLLFRGRMFLVFDSLPTTTTTVHWLTRDQENNGEIDRATICRKITVRRCPSLSSKYGLIPNTVPGTYSRNEILRYKTENSILRFPIALDYLLKGKEKNAHSV